jgi:hypothetical protein
MSSHGIAVTGTVRWHPTYPPEVAGLPNGRHPVVPQYPFVQALVAQSLGMLQVL